MLFEMSSILKLIKRQREIFSRKKSISDQKNIDFSVRNIRLSEIVDFIIWSASRSKDDKEKK